VLALALAGGIAVPGLVAAGPAIPAAANVSACVGTQVAAALKRARRRHIAGKTDGYRPGGKGRTP
jgi:hypothetical protein